MQLFKATTTPKVLGQWMLIALVTGNMIGSGIFLLPSSLAPYGGLSLISWLLTSGGALLLALVFAKLSMKMPKEGGPYAYAREAFGDFMGFQVAFNYWIAVVVANAATIVAMIAYLTVFWPNLANDPWLSFLITTGTIWGITLINVLGVREAGMTQLILTLLKVVPLVLLVIFGLSHVEWANLSLPQTTNESNWQGIWAAAGLTMWAFAGLESATIPAAYAQNAAKTIPRATMLGTLFTAALYILATTVVMGMIAPGELASSNAPFSEAASQLIGHWGAWLVAFVAALSCFSTTVGWILLQGQVPLAAAMDHLFPAVFAKVSKNGTPVAGLLISSVIVTVLLYMNYQHSLIDQFTVLVKMSTLAFLIPYLFTTVAHLVLTVKHPQRFTEKRPWLMVMAALGAFVYIFLAIFGLGQELIYYGTLLFFLGAPLYVWIKIRQPLKYRVVE